MQQSLPREVKRCLHTRKVPHILENPYVHYRVHKSPHHSISGTSWIDFTLPFHFCTIHFNIILKSTCRHSWWSVSFRDSYWICTYCFPINATCPANLRDHFNIKWTVHWSPTFDFHLLQLLKGARGNVVVKALYYKPEGRGFETRWGEGIFFNLRNPSGRTRPWGSLSL
jgi:hypothetical protein